MSEFEPLISVAELQQHYDGSSWALVDCRFDLMQPDKGREEYRQGHIPGAVFADLNRDLAAPVTERSGRHPLPDAVEFAAFVGRLGIANDTRVVVYDYASGALAARLWWMLRWLGHRRVAVLEGGIAAWREQLGEMSSDTPEVRRRQFLADADDGSVIDTEDLRQSLMSDVPPCLVDARDPARFQGLREPIDAVAGHVPGAVNFPFSDSLNADGTWREAAQLRELWGAVLGSGQPRSWVAMCGSGVTACHLALSAQLAGFPAPRLYVGSWSEWIRDPQRPVASGE